MQMGKGCKGDLDLGIPSLPYRLFISISEDQR